MIAWGAIVVFLLILGLALLAIEIFVIPGIGAVGFLGAASLLGAAVLAWFFLGKLEGTLAFLIGVAGAGGLFWYFPRSAAGRALVLHEVQRSKAVDNLTHLVGKRGIALTPLRPSGAVEIDGRSVDVVAESMFVEAGTQVRVTQVEGTRVVVEPAPNYYGG